jgi:hypothetical protein
MPAKKSKLTKAQQMAFLKALPPTHRKLVKAHFVKHVQAGGSFIDELKKFGSKAVSFLGPVIKDVAPIVLKQFVLPMLQKKFMGSGLSLAGSGLKLAGQGAKRKPGRPKKKAHGGEGLIDDLKWALNTPIMNWKI